MLVPLAAYCIAGAAYKIRAKGASGAEAIPHVEFWRGLPGLVRDGCSTVAAASTFERPDEERRRLGPDRAAYS
uniref:Autophagy-related protein 27 n=1 Tax=Marseillevirus LCMAC103 TaxID=2506604 RepID=A0A481YX15_9VIRU|nr:MAG: autophagy-related protein 27 [Marseillevirus LCMAC103]